ncbi:unnamed protein product, partial [Leptidea sinapis]
MDLSTLCRSCMKEVASWEKENFNNRAVEMFSFCTNIKVTDDEKLPQQFCYDCTIKIESSYTFIKEAKNVDVTLKNLILRSNASVIVQPENKIESTHKVQSVKLTLPDYKLSIGTINFSTQDVISGYGVQNTNNIVYSSGSTQANVEPTILEKILNKSEEEAKVATETNKKNMCQICQKSFISKVWFTKHMEKEHSGHKFICTVCCKSFKKQCQLKYHVITHSEERNFACSTCGKRYKRRKQLATHTRTHSDVRPYACDKCSLRFKLKSILKCHMKVHEDVKQYLCSYCGWSFSQ